jgi:hypothetical protein
MPATPDIIPTDLTLEIGDDLPPDRFLAAVRAFFGYVQEIEAGLDGDALGWTVRVREGSALIAIDPAPAAPPELVESVYTLAEHGIRDVANGQIDKANLSESALRHLKVLSELTVARQDRIVPMQVWVRRRPISLTPRIRDVIREDRRADYNDFGTVEGRLETIQDRDGSLLMHIRDRMFRQKIRCYFPEEMLPDVFDKFRRRVEISGVIHYRHNGVPISIEAAVIDALPDDDELPTAEDVRGILRTV